MAKNFLDHALGLIGLKSPNATDYYEPSMYRTDVSKIEVTRNFSSVEQYQQKKNTNDTETKELSGVEKYLAAKQQPEQEQKSTEDATVKELTGVAKYLSTKQQEQAALANMTGVAKYLFNLKTQNKATPAKKTAPEKKEKTVKLSRVDMYLAKKQEPVLEKYAAKVSTKTPKEEPKITPKVKEKVKAHAKNEKEKPAQITEKTTNKIIDLTEGATQCQAATLKRTQCSRKTSLETIERTVNKQQYKFTVCSQHNIDSFTPFGEFLQEG